MQNILKWALFINGVNIIISLIFFIGGLSVNPDLSWIRWVELIVVPAIFTYLGAQEKKREEPGEFTFGKGWTNTVLITLVAGVIGAIWVYLYTTVIDTEMIEMVRNAQKLEMLKMLQEHKITQEQIEQSKGFTSFFISPAGFAISTLFMYPIIGMLLGLLISPIAKAMGNDNLPPTEPAA